VDQERTRSVGGLTSVLCVPSGVSRWTKKGRGQWVVCRQCSVFPQESQGGQRQDEVGGWSDVSALCFLCTVTLLVQ